MTNATEKERAILESLYLPDCYNPQFMNYQLVGGMISIMLWHADKPFQRFRYKLNNCYSSWDIDQLLTHVESAPTNFVAKRIILSVGYQESRNKNFDINLFMTSFENLVRVLKSKGCEEMIVTNVPPCAGLADRVSHWKVLQLLNDAIRKFCTENCDLFLCNIFSLFCHAKDFKRRKEYIVDKAPNYEVRVELYNMASKLRPWKRDFITFSKEGKKVLLQHISKTVNFRVNLYVMSTIKGVCTGPTDSKFEENESAEKVNNVLLDSPTLEPPSSADASSVKMPTSEDVVAFLNSVMIMSCSRSTTSVLDHHSKASVLSEGEKKVPVSVSAPRLLSQTAAEVETHPEIASRPTEVPELNDYLRDYHEANDVGHVVTEDPYLPCSGVDRQTTTVTTSGHPWNKSSDRDMPAAMTDEKSDRLANNWSDDDSRERTQSTPSMTNDELVEKRVQAVRSISILKECLTDKITSGDKINVDYPERLAQEIEPAKIITGISRYAGDKGKPDRARNLSSTEAKKFVHIKLKPRVLKDNSTLLAQKGVNKSEGINPDFDTCATNADGEDCKFSIILSRAMKPRSSLDPAGNELMRRERRNMMKLSKNIHTSARDLFDKFNNDDDGVSVPRDRRDFSKKSRNTSKTSDLLKGLSTYDRNTFAYELSKLNANGISAPGEVPCKRGESSTTDRHPTLTTSSYPIVDYVTISDSDQPENRGVCEKRRKCSRLYENNRTVIENDDSGGDVFCEVNRKRKTPRVYNSAKFLSHNFDCSCALCRLGHRQLLYRLWKLIELLESNDEEIE